MCGFFVIKDKILDDAKANKALNKILHRGPDNSKYLIHDNIFFGFNRLSIQDLSSNADQPMVKNFDNKKIVILFNGEIYNFKEIKKNDPKISNIKFTSSSDTEVLLNLYISYGFEKMLQKIEGMFSICIYDEIKKKIFLARDHFGQKPLYYYLNGTTLAVSSEIKSITTYIDNFKPDFKASLYPLFCQLLPTRPKTMIKNIFSLEPGYFLCYDLNNNNIKKQKYFNIENLISEEEYNDLDNISEKEYLLKLDYLLSNSVKKMLISDAPVGIAFSGGIDSSLITSYVNELGISNLYLVQYTNNFDKNNFAEYFKGNHISVDEKNVDLKKNFPAVSYYSSFTGREDTISLFEVSKLAKSKGLKVLLTGDCADEMTGAYFFYLNYYLNNKFIDKKIFKSFLFKGQLYFNYIFKNSIYAKNTLYFDNASTINSELLVSNLFSETDINQMFNYNISQYDFIKNKHEKMYKGFILNDISQRLEVFLNRSDTYGMSESIELRVPFLDLEVVKFFLNSPMRRLSKVNFFFRKTKLPLRSLLKKKNIPNKVINQAKIGTPNMISDSFYKEKIMNEKFVYLSNLLNCEPSKIKNTLINTNSSHNRRDLFSFLSTEYFFRTHLGNEDWKII